MDRRRRCAETLGEGTYTIVLDGSAKEETFFSGVSLYQQGTVPSQCCVLYAHCQVVRPKTKQDKSDVKVGDLSMIRARSIVEIDVLIIDRMTFKNRRVHVAILHLPVRAP
jgi:hypothetical protein